MKMLKIVLEEVAHTGCLSPEVVFVDGTHIKASANLKKYGKKQLKKNNDDDDPPKENRKLAIHKWRPSFCTLLLSHLKPRCYIAMEFL